MPVERIAAKMKLNIPTCALLFAVTTSSPAKAQQSVSWAGEAALAGGTGHGGEFRYRGIIGTRLALTRRSLTRPHLGYYGELAYEWVELAMGEDAVCQLSSRGGCLAAYPAFSGYTLTGGLFLQPDSDIEFRLGAGPAALAPQDGPRVGAMMMQADFAGFLSHAVGIVAGGRVIVMPRYRRDRLTMNQFVLGIRIR